MVLFILPLGVATAVALLAGGTVWPIAETRFRFPVVLLAGIALQLFVPFVTEAAAITLVLVSLASAMAFLLMNRSLPGLMLVTIGVACNGATMLLNRGMPVSVNGAESVGNAFHSGVRHNASMDDTHLAWLGDVLPIPGLDVIASVGDLLMVAGLCLFVYFTMTHPRSEA